MGIVLSEAGEIAEQIANYDTIRRITADPADRWQDSAGNRGQPGTS
jgi:hypothetical protein